MIILSHNSNQVISIFKDNQSIAFQKNHAIGRVLFDICEQFSNEIIIWTHQNCIEDIALEAIPELLHHNKMILFYNPNKSALLSHKWGYVDHSSVLEINKEVSFFSWQISGFLGVSNTNLLRLLKNQIPNLDEDFEYLLHSLGKRAQPEGLFCNYEPQLIQNKNYISKVPFSMYTLFKFVKQHKPFKWLLVLFFNLMLYEKRFPLFPFISALFYKLRTFDTKEIEKIELKSTKKTPETLEVDVIIPTIGRPQHVKNVLLDLSKQTVLPKKVIIVEQNPEPSSSSDLDFINTKTWPFLIEHVFTHKSGACNARNIALSKVKSDWVFMCDDDNRFSEKLIEEVFKKIRKYGLSTFLTAYPQKNEINLVKNVHQTIIFGSGNSFLQSKLLEHVSFDSSFEFCYGEDFDFGMQLRMLGIDIVNFPEPVITHLKAPMGGFRTKPILPWHDDAIQPKPSPTIILNYLKYRTLEQLRAYKTIYFVQQLRYLGMGLFIKNFSSLQESWKASIIWAKRLQL